MNFKEKVKSMTIKEIVLAMIHGLEHEHVKVDMSTYGGRRSGICYGCAATNAICEITGNNFPSNAIRSFYQRSNFLQVDNDFLENFEAGINRLRAGNLRSYNYLARNTDLPEIPEEVVRVYNDTLPILRTDNYKPLLESYKKFAEAL